MKYFMLLVVVTILSGCSTGLIDIDRTPEPVPWKNLSLGQSRAEVSSLLKQRPEDAGPPLPDSFIKTVEGKNGGLTFDYFQFIDCYGKSLKSSRTFLYTMVDIMSIGLGQVNPLESNMPQGTKCVATVGFDSKDKLAYYVVKKDNGEVLRQGGILPCTQDDPWCCSKSNLDRPDWCNKDGPKQQIEDGNQKPKENVNRIPNKKPGKKKVEKTPSNEKPLGHKKSPNIKINKNQNQKPSTPKPETQKGMEGGKEPPQ